MQISPMRVSRKDLFWKRASACCYRQLVGGPHSCEAFNGFDDVRRRITF
jgi:hypothetical protein